MIKEFNRETLRVLRKSFDADLMELQIKYGLTFKVGHISYTDTSATIKVEAALSGVDVAKENFNFYATKFGLKPEYFGKVTKINGIGYQVAGIKPRARKYPILMKNLQNGVTVKVPSHVVKQALAVEEIPLTV